MRLYCQCTLLSNGSLTHSQNASDTHNKQILSATLAVAICIIRGIPVLIEGRKYVTATFLEQQ